MKKLLLSCLAFMLTVNTIGCGNKCKNGHEWKEATCTEAKTCSVCGTTEGSKKEHVWEDATCAEPKTCSECGATEGVTLDHKVDSYSVIKEASCSEYGEKQGECTLCGKITTAVIPEKHIAGEWRISRMATSTIDGEKSLHCSVCDSVMRSERLLPEEIEALREKEYKNTYSYKEIARNPNDFKGQKAKFTGEVVQVMENGMSCAYLVDITKTTYSWDDTIYVTYTKKDVNEDRILEDDIITIYGTLSGNYTYETVLGAERTIPSLKAETIEIN